MLMKIFSVFLWIPRVLLTLFIIWLLGFIFFAIYVTGYPTPSIAEATDGIVVFTGGKGRVVEGLRIFRQQAQKPLLLISGLRCDISSLLSPRDDTERIIVDYAKNTKENAIFTKKWLTDNRMGSLRLVTSYYHLPRSLWEARKWPASVKVIPHPVHLQTHMLSYTLLKEYSKFIITVLEIF